MVSRLPPGYPGAEGRRTELVRGLLEDGTSIRKFSCEFSISECDVHSIRDILDAWIFEDLLVVGNPVSLMCRERYDHGPSG